MQYFQPPLNLQFLKLLSDPTISGLLMLVGLYALIFGLSNPGIGSEALGVVALAIGLIGLGFNVNAKGLEIALLVFCGLWCAFTFVIYFSVVSGGCVEIWGINNTFTLRHYRLLVRDGMDALQTTLILAGVSSPLTAIVSILLAYLVVRHRFPGRAALEFTSMLSFAIPGTVIGIGYIMAFNQSPFMLTGTATILVISFIFRNMPVGIRSGVAALAQIDQALEGASVTLRASFALTLRCIILPLIRPAILSALVFSFVRAVTAISAVVFLVSARWQLSTKVILDQAENGRYGLATAYSTVLIVFMAAAIVLILDLKVCQEYRSSL